jgi:hypothetical protein
MYVDTKICLCISTLAICNSDCSVYIFFDCLFIQVTKNILFRWNFFYVVFIEILCTNIECLDVLADFISNVFDILKYGFKQWMHLHVGAKCISEIFFFWSAFPISRLFERLSRLNSPRTGSARWTPRDCLEDLAKFFYVLQEGKTRRP